VKPGAFPSASALARARSSGVFSPTHDAFYTEARRRLGDRDGTKTMVEVLLGHRTLSGKALVCGMESALRIGSVDPQVVLIEARKATGSHNAEALPIESSLVRFDRPAPCISHYDDLLEAT
jgi:hypothetical protein